MSENTFFITYAFEGKRSFEAVATLLNTALSQRNTKFYNIFQVEGILIPKPSPQNTTLPQWAYNITLLFKTRGKINM
jgi:hypothetical protein